MSAHPERSLKKITDMRKLLVLTVLSVFAAGTVLAQNHMIVNSETIFRSIDEYNQAVSEIDSMAQTYQDNIDEAYEKVEAQYNTYIQQKSSLTQAQQQEREEAIINNEKRIAEYQEKVFGSEGTLVTMRTEKLEPIQKRVFEAISTYAKGHGFGIALDVATNPLVVYYDPALDKTDEIIAILK